MSNKRKYFIDQKFFLPLVLLLLAAALNFVGSEVIANYFPSRPVPGDLMFKVLPRLSWAYLVSDFANVFSFCLILYCMVHYCFVESPRFLLSFAIAFMMRAFIIILTPLGEINGGDGSFYGVTFVRQLGAFPSGHTIMVVLAYLLIDRKRYPLLSNLALGSIIVEILALITSRGHYSIDIVGGALVAYFAYNYLLKFQNKLSLTTAE